MKQVEQLASFVCRASYDEISQEACNQLKIRVLDALGCAIGALDGEPIKIIQANMREFGGAELCSLIGGGYGVPDRSAFYNSALIRYLDFNDSYLAKGETCHPSDNIGTLLATSEYARRSGKDFLCALAVAYQVQCRLSDIAPVRSKGFDHTVQGAYAVAAGASKALCLDIHQTANAIAIAGTAFNALRVTRTGLLSHWKGLAFPDMAFGVTHTTFLAMRGITGPLEVFEGNKGFMETIAGKFEIDWRKEDLERVRETVIKKYNAEIHSQSVLEGILELVKKHRFTASEIEKIEVEIFDVAYNIIGGGEEGDKTIVQNKEEADHSLPYLVAVAVLDGQIMPEQYLPDRILREDVQSLLKKVIVRPLDAYSRRFPAEFPCRVGVFLQDGQVLTKKKSDYEGFRTRPMTWETVGTKFKSLSGSHADADLQNQIVETVAHLEANQISELMSLLRKIR
jgi:2-methylcitrate dehydratase